MPLPTQNRRRLHLVECSVASVDSGTARPGWDAPPPVARPADRCEAWPLDATSSAPLVRAAAELGITFDLAAVVTVERSLLRDDIHALGFSSSTALLDSSARTARVARELSEPLSEYLGALDRSSRARRHPRNTLVLPMRLTERLGNVAPASRLDAELLPSAIAWERAAVVAGRTMTEWALLLLAACAT